MLQSVTCHGVDHILHVVLLDLVWEVSLVIQKHISPLLSKHTPGFAMYMIISAYFSWIETVVPSWISWLPLIHHHPHSSHIHVGGESHS